MRSPIGRSQFYVSAYAPRGSIPIFYCDLTNCWASRSWSNHEIMNKWMQKFFMYLDRYYVKHHR